jgi:pimeloyl-ACP methyl ester carboxylesterase
VFVKRDGEGPRLFFGLHGWSGDHRTFAPLVRYLPPDAALLSVDLPGCGQSSPPREWDLDGIAGEIAAEIEKLKGQRVTIIGNCSGAILGLIALPLVAEKIERLVLIDPFAYAPWYFRLFVSTPVGEYAYYSTFANPVGRWITNLSLKYHRAEGTDLTASFRAVDHEVSYRYLKLLTEINDVGRFAGVGHPIDIVYGERTFGAVKKSTAIWQSLWPQSRAFELRGAGHLPIEEAAEELSRIVFGDAAGLM